MQTFHPLSTDIPKPARFTYPFCYEPHPLCRLAAEEVKQEIVRISPTEGKMFGVLVVEDGSHRLGFLAAYSGLLEGRNDWPYFVPPVFDAQQPDGHFKQTEREISRLNEEIERLEGGDERLEVRGERIDLRDEKKSILSPLTSHLSPPKAPSPLTSNLSPLNSKLRERRRRLSEELQLWLFHQYKFLNVKGDVKDLVEVWQDYHCSPRIRRKYPLPPGGTGDCCAPKLLQYAFLQMWTPICMAEFWWGPSPRTEVRQHGHFYPACRGKCKPILTWMLQGMDVDPNPEEGGFPRLVPTVVFEDQALAVINKPSGMLSIPGRTEDHSIATWAAAQWTGAMACHRLDMWTSGLMVIAKTKEAYLSLQQQFVKRTIRKRYIAVLDGIVATPKGRIELPLLCDPMNRPRQVVDHRRGKSAVTEYEVLSILELRTESLEFATALEDAAEKRAEGRAAANSNLSPLTSNLSPLTLVALYPHTGRTHQLRVHCAHAEGLGCPIHGDELYGWAPQTLGGVATERLCLHADRLELTHPLSGQLMHFELPYPFDNLIPYNNK